MLGVVGESVGFLVIDVVLYGVNTAYTPSDDDEAVLDVLTDEPCGRANPYLIREKTGLSKQRVSNSLRQLAAAGWVEKVTRGLYDLVGDGRDESDDATADRAQGPVDIEPIVEPSDYTIGQLVDEARAKWGDDPDARRQVRVDSLRAALEAVREEPLSKSELQEVAYPGESVGQNERTWFRKTVKPYLKEIAEYSNSDHKWHYSG